MKRLSALVTTMLLLAGSAWTQSAPAGVSYQGRLTGATGQPLATGDYQLSFRVFDAANGGTTVWGPQTFPAVTVVQGFFTVILGPLDDGLRPISAAFDRPDRYVEVQLGGNPPILPRQQILSTPFAFNGVPTGTVLSFAGATAPGGFLVCDGSAISRTAYAALFQLIGTTYGAGDGSTTFNLPDLRGRVAMGAGGYSETDFKSTQSFTYALGDRPGLAMESLSFDEMPKHYHILNLPGGKYNPGNGKSDNSDDPHPNTPATWPGYFGEPHENRQPSLVLNHIIRY